MRCTNKPKVIHVTSLGFSVIKGKELKVSRTQSSAHPETSFILNLYIWNDQLKRGRN